MNYVFDIETDGLRPTKIYCLSYHREGKSDTLTTYSDMRRFLTQDNLTLVGHNIIRFDIPVLEKLLDIKIKARLIDTLALSWALYPTLKAHGLADWGTEFGVPKPEIDDWESLELSEYVNRCAEDVKINGLLYNKITRDLGLLYDNQKDIDRYINYLCYKMDCIREQEEVKIKFDIDAALKLLSCLEELKQPKFDKLQSIMPDVPVYAVRNYPKVMYKKDGNLSANGTKWIELLKSLSLPGSYKESIKIITGHNKANPCVQQFKPWLESLGWIPETYESRKNTKGEFNDIAQLKTKDGEVCPSIQKLYNKVPELRELGDYLNIKTRIGTVKGLIDSQEGGYIIASMSGFTNTLRLKHKTVVNLPKPTVYLGKEIRALLICEDNEIMVGSDLASLEDRTKQHYIYPYDMKYVESMDTPGYDPHLVFAVFAGALTEEQAEAHKAGTEDHTEIRHIYKTVNYMATYGVGKVKLAKMLKTTEYKAKELLDGYWDLNKSIRSFANDQATKKCLGLTWVFNPVSRFWYQLRANKDIFSTINQSTGAYIFDLWAMEVRNKGIKLRLQMHDELMFTQNNSYKVDSNIIMSPKVTKELKDLHIIEFDKDITDVWQGGTEYMLNGAIEAVNKRLCLNKEMGIDISFGSNYSEVH